MSDRREPDAPEEASGETSGASPEAAPTAAPPEDDRPGEPSPSERPALRFPAALDVKAMGLADPGFEALVRELVLPHIPPPGPEKVTLRTSRGGKYLSVRVHFTATGKAQLEAIYRALRAEPRVLFTL